jgi:5-methylthioadenosine/S-adenosylhomocysteine deaminase
MEQVDILIFAGWIIPVVPRDTVYNQHAIAIKDGNIVAILPSNEAVSKFSASITYRLSTHALIPGLINTHTHAAMNLLRGFADDLTLQTWLTKHIWPAETALMSAEFVADGSLLAMAEMLRAGITCFNDMYFFPDAVAHNVDKVGMRATLGLIVLDFPSAWAEDSSEYLRKAKYVYDAYQDHPLINLALAPHAPYTVSDAALGQVQQLAEQWQLPIHIHIHETAAEIQDAVQNHGQRPLARLDELGLVHNGFLGVHATQLNEDEIALLAARQAHIIHCPESNLKLASGFCPVSKLLQAGVNVALGTDGAASNNDLDILGEMRTAALLAKGVSGDARVIPASQALEMATINAAKALGIDAITGSLEVGKSADIVALDMRSLETIPMYNAISQLVYATGRDKVTDVWVAGEHLLKSRALTRIDIHELMARVVHWRNIIEQLNT